MITDPIDGTLFVFFFFFEKKTLLIKPNAYIPIICISAKCVIFTFSLLVQYFNNIWFSHSACHFNVLNLLKSPFVFNIWTLKEGLQNVKFPNKTDTCISTSVHIDSQNGWGWKAILVVIWSNPMFRQGHLELVAQGHVQTVIGCLSGLFPDNSLHLCFKLYWLWIVLATLNRSLLLQNFCILNL